MRPGQQKQRSRGRGNGSSSNQSSQQGRKGQNPLTRTYDSSGPDVKIRGTAQHIAEKYTNLARDAQSSGDRVMAENYLQHAEHYNRIIAAAQAMFQERFQRDDRGEFGERDNTGQDNADGTEGDYNDNEGGEMEQAAPVTYRRAPEPVIDGSGPQPVIEGTPAEVIIEEAASQPQSRTDRTGPASRRRSAGRPRRQPRRAEGEGESEGGEQPAPPETVE
jgi:hypothetical protein